MQSLNEIEDGLVTEEYAWQVEHLKIISTMMYTFKTYYDLLKEKRQAVKQVKPDIFKKKAQKLSETSNEPLLSI